MNLFTERIKNSVRTYHAPYGRCSLLWESAWVNVRHIILLWDLSMRERERDMTRILCFEL